jgi:hypothetical protein
MTLTSLSWMTPSALWTLSLLDTCLNSKPFFLHAPLSVDVASSFRCIQGILRDRLVILVTHQVQFALQADKLLVLKEVDV